MLDICEKCGKRSKNTRKDGSSICYNCKVEVSAEEAKALREWEKTKEVPVPEEVEPIRRVVERVNTGGVKSFEYGSEDKELEIIKKGGEKMEDKKEDVWEVKEVPTQFGVAIINNKTGEAMDIMGAVTKLLNDVEKLMKLLK